VLSATNRDLKAAVTSGAFREDLFYRLNVFPIQIPPLRDRKDDIHLLVEYLIERYSKGAGKKFQHINNKSLAMLQEYEWPGNIRELQNVVERAVVLCDGETFSVDESWLKLDSRTVPFAGAISNREKELIETALAESHGRVAGAGGAAAKLGIPRQTLDSKMAKLGIDKRQFKIQSAD
jgi:formate hydrogenlyase transcriptional activator